MCVCVFVFQIAQLSDELEKTKTAAKQDIRRLSLELQGLRDEHCALRTVSFAHSPSDCFS